MIDKSLIGKESPPVKNVVERIALRKFVEAIGETNPIYYDEEYSRSTPYGGIIAPPTFCRTFMSGAIPGLQMPREGVVHGEQSYTYFKPLKPGDEVYCRTRLIDVQEKDGRSGKMILVTLEQDGKDADGQLFFTSRQTAIIREEAIKREQAMQDSAKSVPAAAAVEPAKTPRFAQFSPGDEMEPQEMPPVTRMQLIKYSGASGDFNPIHTIDEVALEMGLGGIIAHGMLTMAHLGRFLTDWAGPEGTLVNWGVRFSSMVRPGDVITFRGIINKVEPLESGGIVHGDVWGENTRGEKVITGYASIKLP